MDTAQKKTAVLFVHGLQGSPGQFDFLIRALPEGTPYRSVLLPGHGGSVRQFRQSGREAWERCVRQTAVDLGQQYGRVVFVGHSMGCLLGLKAAMQPGIHFASMLFLACPLRVKITPRYFNLLFRAIGRRPSDDPALLAIRAANSVHTRHPLAYCTCLRPYVEFLRLKREISRVRKKPLLRVTAAFPQKDEIVSAKSAYAARNDWHFAPMMLPGCTHHYFTEEARAVLQQVLQALLQS